MVISVFSGVVNVNLLVQTTLQYVQVFLRGSYSKNRKLISSDTGNDVGFSKNLPEYRRNFNQSLVPFSWPRVSLIIFILSKSVNNKAISFLDLLFHFHLLLCKRQKPSSVVQTGEVIGN